MSQPTQSGVLILSGALYEGADFEAWRGRMEALLKLHGLEKFRQGGEGAYTDGLEDPDEDDYDFNFDLSRWNQMECGPRPYERALQILTDHISPTILSRLHRDVSRDIKQLWLQLPIVARPFRFMDLHSELRNTIYRLHLECDSVRDIDNERIPALLQVSKQVQKETRSIYYAEKRFGLNLCHHLSRPHSFFGGGIAFMGTSAKKFLHESVFKWAEREVRHDMKHLGSFEVFVSKYNSSNTFKLTLSTSGDLEVTGPEDGDFVKHTLQAVRQYVARIEKQRKLLQLKGEAIILALTSEPDMFT